MSSETIAVNNRMHRMKIELLKGILDMLGEVDPYGKVTKIVQRVYSSRIGKRR